MSTSTPSPTDLDFTLQTDEQINVVLLSCAIFIAAICFTVSIFHYSAKSTNSALQFTLSYKILSIILVAIIFFLLITSITTTNSIPSLTEVIMFLLILAAIVIANFIGIRDYRFSCWDNCCISLDFTSGIKKWVVYGLITIMTLILMILIATSDDIRTVVGITMLFGFIISAIFAFFNAISILIAISVILCVFMGLLWTASQSDYSGMDIGHGTKFCLYSFPIVFLIVIFYGITSGFNGYNTFCGLMSILNRASNFVVFFIWISTGNGGIAIGELILIVFTAIMSTISVQYNCNCNAVFIDEKNDHLKSYFLKGKIFTFFGFGRVWFDMITWDKNQFRENIISGYHLIKIYELIFECFPCLSLQIIASIALFTHETITISIIICIIYITLILFGIVYDEKYSQEKEAIITPIVETERSYASVQANSVGIELMEPFDISCSKTDHGMNEFKLDEPQNKLIDNNNKRMTCKDYCAMIGCVLFIWTDFFVRIIPLWYLTKNGSEVVMYLILLYIMDMIFYWLMIAKQTGQLNKCIDILLFSWTGIITNSWYLLMTMDIKYISSVGKKRFLCIEHWLRIGLNVIVTLMVTEEITAGFSFLWIVTLFLNFITGYKLLFGYCCVCKDEPLN